MDYARNFTHSRERIPHQLRPKQILRHAPEIKQLIGKNPYTLLILLPIIALMFGLAYWLRGQSWWWVVGTAFCVGAFASHTLFVIIHECSHNLLFKTRSLNMLTGILANIPQVIPTYVSFTHHHLEHHAHLGVYGLDADLPSRWEAALIRNSSLGKIMWLICFPLFQLARLAHFERKKSIDGWMLLNFAVLFAVDTLVVVVLGPKALAFLFFSLLFSVGPHPLGARWVQEHYLVLDKGQETTSYYGWLNLVALNVGYHNEHHDFPSIPWSRLPRVKAIGGDYYSCLKSHKSWTMLWLRFLFSPKVSLFARMTRDERGLDIRNN
jgi:sphingolipid delta-4 desaturase